MKSKMKRQMKIKELLNNKVITSHDQLVELLSHEEIQITQATLSRDFAEMGVIRVFTPTATRYVLNPDETGRQIAKLIGFEIISVENNESMVIIRTLAGRAPGVAHHIDRLDKQEIIGTVAGDDTVLVIPNLHKNVMPIVSFIKEMMIDNPGLK
jgi:transcriptional regulator of arginine metabolism